MAKSKHSLLYGTALSAVMSFALASCGIADSNKPADQQTPANSNTEITVTVSDSTTSEPSPTSKGIDKIQSDIETGDTPDYVTPSRTTTPPFTPTPLETPHDIESPALHTHDTVTPISQGIEGIQQRIESGQTSEYLQERPSTPPFVTPKKDTLEQQDKSKKSTLEQAMDDLRMRIEKGQGDKTLETREQTPPITPTKQDNDSGLDL